MLDNCDGEIARLKGQSSTFGMHYDTAVDWLVHTGFFVALGIGMSRTTGESWWAIAGVVAGVGGTINYVLGLVLEARDKATVPDEKSTDAEHARPHGPGQWILFVFRELTRADFCFLVLLLAIFDVLWFLVPAGAIGAQVYWMTLCIKSARRFHV